jgi:hypothetical protein
MLTAWRLLPVLIGCAGVGFGVVAMFTRDLFTLCVGIFFLTLANGFRESNR